MFCGDCGFICMISICVADNSYKAIFFFLFITQIILIVFFCGQINHLYDVEDSVYNHFINEKHTVVCIMTKIVYSLYNSSIHLVNKYFSSNVCVCVGGFSGKSHFSWYLLQI